MGLREGVANPCGRGKALTSFPFNVFSLQLSLQVSLVSTLLSVLVGLPVAYILARRDFFAKELMEILFTIPLVLPPTVTGYYLVILFGRNGLIGNVIYRATGWSIMFTWYAAVLASFIVSIPLMIRASKAAIESIDTNLINVAYTLGHGEFETAVRVVIPLAKNGIVAGAILSFARGIGEFGATIMLAGNIPGKTDTMPIAIYTLAASGEWTKTHLMVIILTVISGAVIYLSNRFTKRTFF
ncbi:MAG: molybdate ABC transporter permease subunit [Nitrospirae bacterium]|nr:molybdate ABC transporter permease subunit [Nitrospirota bacterium]